MMSKLTSFSLKNPLAIFILIFLLLFGGVYSSTKLNLEAMPDTSAPVVYVNVVYPGASAKEALAQVTAPLESAIQSVEGVIDMSSTTSDALTFIRVEFDSEEDLDAKKSKVEEAVNSVNLPNDILFKRVHKNSAESNPILYSALSAKDGVSEAEFQKELTDTIIPAVRQLQGVHNIQVLGQKTNKLMIQVDPNKLMEKQVSYQQVTKMIEEQNLNGPLGTVTLDKKNETVTLNGSLHSKEKLSNLSLRTEPEVRLKDIATLEYSNSSETITSINGKPSVTFNILKSEGSNTVKVSELVQKELRNHSDKVEFHVIYDTANDIKSSISGLVREGALGALFASLIILFFLRNFRATFISIISIPLSFLITLICMLQLGIPLNIMTLAGIVVATGRVVDDSIVVIENIIRRNQTEKMSIQFLNNAVKEVSKAIVSSTIASIAVFAPLAMLNGSIGIVFGPFATTVVICLLASLFVSITVVPVLAYYLMRKSKTISHHAAPSKLALSYQKALNWSLNHKLSVIIISLILFLGSLPIVAFIGFNFLPEGEDKAVAMQLTLPRGTDLLEVQHAAEEIDQKLRQDHRVENAQLIVGSPSGQSKTASVNNAATWMITLSSDTNIEQFIKDKKNELQPKEKNKLLDVYRIVMTPGGPDIRVTVNGPNRDVIERAAAQLTAAIAKIDGTENVTNNLQEGIEGVEVIVNHDIATTHELTSAQIGYILRPFFTEQKIATLLSDQDETPVFMQLADSKGIHNIEEISNLQMLTPAGTPIQIKEVAKVTKVDQPGSLQRLNGQEYASVTASIVGDNKSAVNKKVKETIQSLKLPEGASYSLGGSNEQINEMLMDMGVAIIVAIAVVYMVLVLTFGGGKVPFAILFSIPFSVIGSLVAMYIAKQPLSLNGMIGFLMLIGIVVSNAIVLLDRVGQQMESGESVRASLLAASIVRLRPILMTAIATMIAILPMVLGIGNSMVISQGLAVVVLGGLISSTFLTLFIVPIVFEILYRKRRKAEKVSPLSGVNK
ncbi:efflux RND transporter permease subunit [Lysinibacillus sp. M3]|uniref:Efflux RND transporter permease subunit n=1 Tax=Lysinibacillus zambalensis TaxID=3160866 RepID=A0ABV1MYC2_9BACI